MHFPATVRKSVGHGDNESQSLSGRRQRQAAVRVVENRTRVQRPANGSVSADERRRVADAHRKDTGAIAEQHAERE